MFTANCKWNSFYLLVLIKTNWKSCRSRVVSEMSSFWCHTIARKHPYRADTPHFQLHLASSLENQKEHLLNYSVNAIFPVCRSPKEKKPEVKASWLHNMLPWKHQCHNNSLKRPKVVTEFHTYHMVSFKDKPSPLISERIMTEPVLYIPDFSSILN